MSKELDDAFGRLLDNLEQEALRKIAAGEDDGHNKLILDLEDLVARAKSGHFNDFHPAGAATPKLALIGHLQKLIDNTTSARYDN